MSSQPLLTERGPDIPMYSYRDPDYIIELVGKIPSSKNTMIPRDRNGKGGKGFMMRPDVKAQIEAISLECIRPEVKDLRLLHPDIIVEYHVAETGSDINNMWTTIVDMLVKAGVFWNDNIESLNGHEYKVPAIVDGTWVTIIRIWDSGQSATKKMVEDRIKKQIATKARKKQRSHIQK